MKINLVMRTAIYFEKFIAELFLYDLLFSLNKAISPDPIKT
jgi:hypothetical protein